MVEMIETANILNQATDKSLVLMDEVGRGTATTDGLAIAHACVNRLLEIGCLTLFATHYFELTQLAKSSASHESTSNVDNNGIRNVHVAASDIDGQLLLLHQIRDGAASSSFGLHVAKMAGIPKDVLDDAKRYLQQTLNTDKGAVKNGTVDDKNDLAKSGKDKRASQNDKNATITAAHNDTQYRHSENNQQQKQLFSVYHQLNSIDPDSLTPKQALELLYQLKQLINH